MAQVIWTEQATAELEEIAHYLDAFSVHYAAAIVKKLYGRAQVLGQFPRMGRVIPELGDGRRRELLEGNYRLMYELLDEDVILIQRVIHSARDFQ
jgi:toxin ParE1/3/4